LAVLSAFWRPQSRRNPQVCTANSLRNVTGNFFNRTGNSIRHNRELFLFIRLDPPSNENRELLKSPPQA
jgi:hypothetical protein